MVNKRLIVLVGLFVFGTGCTDSGTPVDATSTPLSDGVPSAGPNGIHNGEVWVTRETGTTRINLQTGKETLVYFKEAYPTRDGAFHIMYADGGTKEDPDCSFRYFDDVTSFNVLNTNTRESVSKFDTVRMVIGPVRLSPDIKRVAMFASEIEACDTNFNEVRMMVFSIEGEELYRNSGVAFHDYDWHPDGRLVVLTSFVHGNRYAIEIETAPGSYEFVELFSFTAPPGVYGYRGLRVGPTGKDAVIEAVTEQNSFLSSVKFREGSVHHFPLFPVDELGETDVFEHGEGVRNVNGPTFSPDGKHILVTEGYVQGALIYSTTDPDISVIQGLEVVPVLPISASYVVPVETRLQPMPPAQFSEKILPVLTTRSGRLGPDRFNPLIELTWTPAIACNPEFSECD